jgi:hypothetical protein
MLSVLECAADDGERDAAERQGGNVNARITAKFCKPDDYEVLQLVITDKHSEGIELTRYIKGKEYLCFLGNTYDRVDAIPAFLTSLRTHARTLLFFAAITR